MSQPACPRAFEAEALRDGRLTGGERTSFERHLTLCAACSHEIAELDALAAALHGSPEKFDELHTRRERVRLLAAFDAALVKPKRAVPKAHWLVTAGIATGIAAGLCAAAWSAVHSARTAPAQAKSVRVHAEGLAVWSAHTQGSEETVKLEDGELRIQVDHRLGNSHLVVVVPDGELEDIGTTFVVSVAGGHTKRIAVEEGRVLVRLRGLPAHTVNAGDTWLPEPPSAPPKLATSPNANASASASASPSLSASASGAAPRPLVTDAAADFRAAMAALSRGDNHQAERMLAAFLQKHPHDAHAEDAAYSRVIALQRCGDAAQTRQAAAQYLARYPAGFRRTEIEALAH